MIFSFRGLGEWAAAEFVYQGLIEDARREFRYSDLREHNGLCDEAREYQCTRPSFGGRRCNNCRECRLTLTTHSKAWKCSSCHHARQHFWNVYSIDPSVYLLAFEIVRAAEGRAIQYPTV